MKCTGSILCFHMLARDESRHREIKWTLEVCHRDTVHTTNKILMIESYETTLSKDNVHLLKFLFIKIVNNWQLMSHLRL